MAKKKSKRTAAQIAATKRMMAVNAAKRAEKAKGLAVPKGRAGRKRASLQPKPMPKAPAVGSKKKRKRTPRKSKAAKPGVGVMGTSSGKSARRRIGALFI